jgi:hypothetical protein
MSSNRLTSAPSAAQLSAELPASLSHPANPCHRSGSQVRVLTRRGWRSVSHLNQLAQEYRALGVPAPRAFRFLGLA